MSEDQLKHYISELNDIWHILNSIIETELDNPNQNTKHQQKLLQACDHISRVTFSMVNKLGRMGANE